MRLELIKKFDDSDILHGTLCGSLYRYIILVHTNEIARTARSIWKIEKAP